MPNRFRRYFHKYISDIVAENGAMAIKAEHDELSN
jgi:hypothetical protein